jgi:Di-haem cytochrome c peroxidase
MLVRNLSAVLPLACFVGACNASQAPADSKNTPGAAPSASSSATAVAETKPALKPTSREGSAIVRAPQDDVLFVADEDHRALYILPLPIREDTPITTVAVPGRPAQIVASGDRVLVTIREMPEGGGGVVLFQRKDKTGLEEKARVSVPNDAWGLALSPDESFVAVTSPWVGKVSIVDLATAKVRSTVDVSREPRGINILPDGKRAYVSHLTSTAITRIDIDGSTLTAKKFDFPAAPLRGRDNTGASLGYTVASTPGGERLFFARHGLGTNIGDWFGASAIDVWLPRNDTALVPAMPKLITALNGQQEPESVKEWRGREPGATSFIQPRAMVYRSKERTLLVASEGTDQLVEFDAMMQDPSLFPMTRYTITKHENKIYDVATSCGAPSGIALSANERTAYVYCRSTDDVVAVRLDSRDVWATNAPPVALRLVAPKTTPEDESFQLGRALFYNATDAVTSGNLACAGCHPDGRDDGYVWHEIHFKSDLFNEEFVNFMSSDDSLSAVHERASFTMGYGCQGGIAFEAVEKDPEDEYAMGFPRQTPMLAGRVSAPGPYGWHGESEDLVKRLVDGFGLHRWRLGEGTLDNRRARAGHLAKFVREGLVPPEATKRELTEEEKKGKTIFESDKAQCARCHVPQTGFTDRAPIPVGDPPARKGFVPEKNISFKTPSLVFVRGTAPYFHDGRYESLQALIEKNPDTMGKTMHLSADDKKALVAYLETL